MNGQVFSCMSSTLSVQESAAHQEDEGKQVDEEEDAVPLISLPTGNSSEKVICDAQNSCYCNKWPDSKPP